MAKGEEAWDPVSHLPQDGRWYPAEVEPGVWQGRRSWVEDLCTHADHDVEGEQAVTFTRESKCQARCNKLNARLPK